MKSGAIFFFFVFFFFPPPKAAPLIPRFAPGLPLFFIILLLLFIIFFLVVAHPSVMIHVDYLFICAPWQNCSILRWTVASSFENLRVIVWGYSRNISQRYFSLG